MPFLSSVLLDVWDSDLAPSHAEALHLSFQAVAGDDDADALFRSLVRRSDTLLADLAAELAEGVTTRRTARAAVDRPRDFFAPGFLAPLADEIGDALFAADLAARVRIGRKADALSLADHPAFPAPAEAVEFLLNKRLMPWSDMEGALADYRTRAFWMARVEEVRILATVRDKLADVLKGDLTDQSFVDAIREGVSGDFTTARLHTVLRTNLQSAYQAGNYVQLHHPDVVDLFPYYQYVAIDDGRARPAHLAMNGLIFAAGHRIWLLWWPPNGYNCRCTIIALTLEDAKALGITRSARWPEVSPGAGAVQPDSNFAGPPTDFDWQKQAAEAEQQAAKDTPGVMSREEIEQRLSSDPIHEQTQFGGTRNATYRIKDGVEAVFKPTKGEGNDTPGGIKKGSRAHREVAAYEIDKELGFDLVPPTVERKLPGLGNGAAQEFVRDAADLSDGMLRGFMQGGTQFANQEEMMAFDTIIGNTDRHYGNFKVRAGDRAVAIDNGDAFPAKPGEAKLRMLYASWNPVEAVSPRIHAALDRFIGREADVRRTLQAVGLKKPEIDGVIYRARKLRQRSTWPTKPWEWGDFAESLGVKDFEIG